MIYRRKNSKTWWMSKCVDGIQYRQSTGTVRKMEAQAIYEEWAAGIKSGRPVPAVRANVKSEKMTFRELAEKYLEYARGRLKSYDRLKSFAGTLIKRFGDKLIEDFTMFDLESLQGDILRKGQSRAYANRLVVLAKVMFNKAFDWELVNEDVIKQLKRCKLLNGEVKRLRYLSDKEAETLLSNCDAHLKPLIIMALNTGMRKSEMLGLTWDKVDLKNRLILLDKTKNGERREIPINDTLYGVLSGLTRHIKTDYVFYNPQTLKPYQDFKKPFLKALAKSRILDFRFHDLRHTFASWLIMKGADLTTVKELLGHKDIKMTLRYSHLSQAHIKNGVKLLEKDYHIFSTLSEKKEISNL